MKITGLDAYKHLGAPIAHAFFVAPGGKFYEVALFTTHAEQGYLKKAILVRRWGKYGSKAPGLVREYRGVQHAQRKFSQTRTEKKLQRWKLVEDTVVDHLAALVTLALPADAGRPTKYRHRPQERTCSCDAYKFPHRRLSGGCDGHEIPDDDDYDDRPSYGYSLYGGGSRYGRY